MKSVEVYVVTHKKMDLVLPEHCKLIQVNANKQGQWTGYLHDNDSQDNISDKNNSYCELTALYSLWKNGHAAIGGLFHYRRFFSGNVNLSLKNEALLYTAKNDLKKRIITTDEINELLSKADIIMEIPSAPLPLTVFEDLQKFVYIDDIWRMIDVIEENFPAYRDALWSVLNKTNISYCNMFIARRQFIEDYCSWLFDVLAQVEARTDITEYDASHQRIFGYLAEVLLNVYVLHYHLTAATVYRMDLLEGDKKAEIRNHAKETVNRLLVSMKIYPMGQFRSVLKSRYQQNCEGGLTFSVKGESYERAISEITRYLKKAGAKNVTKQFLGGRYCRITAQSIFADLNFFVLNSQACLQEAEKTIAEERKATVSFGSVVVYRIICPGGVDDQVRRRLLKKGITVYG